MIAWHVILRVQKVLPLGKNIVKRTTQVNGHSLKVHFCMFKKSQGKQNSLDYHKILGIFSINYKNYMFKAWHIFKMFLHVQNIQTLRMDNLYFFKHHFFLPNVHHSFWELERILTLMIIKVKWLELMKIVYITNLSTFGSNVFLLNFVIVQLVIFLMWMAKLTHL